MTEEVWLRVNVTMHSAKSRYRRGKLRECKGRSECVPLLYVARIEGEDLFVLAHHVASVFFTEAT